MSRSALPFSAAEYEGRWQRLHEEMRRCGHEIALVWSQSGFNYERAMDVAYLSNYYSAQEHEPDSPMWNARSYAAVIVRLGHEPELHTDEAQPLRARLALDEVHGHDDVVAGVAARLVRLAPAAPVLFVGSDLLPVKYARELEAATPRVVYAHDDDLVRRIRRIKSEAELAYVRRGGEIATAAMNRLMESLIRGEKECEAAAAAAAEVIRAGGAYHAIPCCHGARTADFVINPLTGYSELAPQPGDLVRGWVFGPIYQGYWLDPGRTAVSGARPSPEQRALIEDCASLVEAIIEAVRPGARVLDAIEVAERRKAEIGAEASQGGEMWPYFGHGNGSMWEPPRLHRDLCGPDEVFEPGMVASAEFFLNRAGVGCAGIEQNYIVTPTGAEVITGSPLRWW